VYKAVFVTDTLLPMVGFDPEISHTTVTCSTRPLWPAIISPQFYLDTHTIVRYWNSLLCADVPLRTTHSLLHWPAIVPYVMWWSSPCMFLCHRGVMMLICLHPSSSTVPANCPQTSRHGDVLSDAPANISWMYLATFARRPTLLFAFIWRIRGSTNVC